MKRFLLMLSVLVPLCGWAQTTENVALVRNGKQFTVSMDINLDRELVKHTKAYVLTPVLVNGDMSQELEPVGYYSKDKFYHYVEEAGVSNKEQAFTKADLPVTVNYCKTIRYEHWMNGAKLVLVRSYEGCCGDADSFDPDTLGQYVREPFNFVPEYIYVQPEAENGKVRDMVDEAIVHFPVNSTKLNNKYLENNDAVGRIQQDIDDVASNPDFDLKKVYLNSASSPEGSYKHNAELAEGRVKAIRDYIAGKLDIPEETFVLSTTPEDMDGLRAYIAESNLADKDELLAIMDSDKENDAKEAELRKHGASWSNIIKNCMPKLRRTQYRVEYGVRDYTDPKDILEQVYNHPENLSLNEFYIAANAYEAGSDKFVEVNRIALSQYPEDEIANLNAANAEMEAGNLEKAGELLEKAGDSAEAEYARGIYYCHRGQFGKATPHLQKAADGGIAKAEQLLDDIDR